MVLPQPMNKNVKKTSKKREQKDQEIKEFVKIFMDYYFYLQEHKDQAAKESPVEGSE